MRVTKAIKISSIFLLSLSLLSPQNLFPLAPPSKARTIGQALIRSAEEAIAKLSDIAFNFADHDEEFTPMKRAAISLIRRIQKEGISDMM